MQYECQGERSPKRCPYCGTWLKDYYLYENGEAVYIETEEYCHACRRRVTYYKDIRKVEY